MHLGAGHGDVRVSVCCASFPVREKLNRCCALKINSFELFQVSEETEDKDNPLGAWPCRLREPPRPVVLCVPLPSFPGR